MPLPRVPVVVPRFRQRNPTLDKVGLLSGLAGATQESVILRELSGRLVIDLAEGESLKKVKILGEHLPWEYLPGRNPDGGRRAWSFIPYADVCEVGRNYLWVQTDRGATNRQIWVGSGGGIFLNNFDITLTCPYLFCDKHADASLGAEDVTLSLNILPYTNDEFFRQQEYSGNRWCNTLRNHGGVVTAQVFIDKREVIPETDVLDIHGYYWPNPDMGYHQVTARLRSEWGSRYYKDIVGVVKVRNLPCPETTA